MDDKIKEILLQAAANTRAEWRVQDVVLLNEFARLLIKEAADVAAFGDPGFFPQHNIYKHFDIKE